MKIIFEHLEVCGSNHVIARTRPVPERKWLCITAGRLTDGIGASKNSSQVRSWIAPEGSLYVTLLAPRQFVCKSINLHLLPLFTGIAIFNELKDVLSEHDHHEKVEFKWPNDILIDDKKICGILCEKAPKAESIHDGSFLFSFGVNVVPIVFSEDFKRSEGKKNSGILEPTWLQKYLPTITSDLMKERIVSRVVYQLEEFVNNKEPDRLLRNALADVAIYGQNEMVKVIVDDQEVIEGELVTIDPRDGLILKNRDDPILSGRIVKK